MNRGLFFSLVLLLCVAPWGARARVQSLTVEHDERAGFLLGSFGYWSGGVLELVLRDMEVRFGVGAGDFCS